MKNRKRNGSLELKLAATILAGALALALLAGCGTTTSTAPVVSTVNGVTVTNTVVTTNQTVLGIVITPQSVYNTLRAGTAQNARIALQADPTNSLPYLNAARAVLANAVGSTAYDSGALQAAFKGLPIGSIKNPDALMAINAGIQAFAILEPILAVQVNSKNKFITPALQGIFDGIGDALGIVAPQPLFSEEFGVGSAECLIPRARWTEVQDKLAVAPTQTAENLIRFSR
jgi:hypothetical protein